MCKNIAFAQGHTVLVPKQQKLVGEFLKLTICILCEHKKINTNWQRFVIAKVNHEILWWNFEFRARYDAGWNSQVFIVFSTVTSSVKSLGAVRTIVCNHVFKMLNVFVKFCKIEILWITHCSLHCGESGDIDFLSVVAVAMELLRINGI